MRTTFAFVIVLSTRTLPPLAAAEGEPKSTVHADVASSMSAPSSPQAPAAIAWHPLAPGTVFERTVVGTDVSPVAAGGGRLIYSNTHGSLAIAPGADNLIADDIATTAAQSCELGYFEFDVTGRADPAKPGGPYSVRFALYDRCPGSIPTSEHVNAVIPGTEGEVSFPDERLRTIVFVPPNSSAILLPATFWLGMSFSTDNAGIVIGAPAFEGHSDDAFYFPGAVACISNFGGFPWQPHGSFNARVFARDDCSATHIQYRANNQAGLSFRPGANNWVVDDLELLGGGCSLSGYEVAVRGAARYDLELRETCDGKAVPGTQTFRIVQGPYTQVLRISIDPPIELPPEPWLAVRVNSNAGGPIVTGDEPSIGATRDVLGVHNPGGLCAVHDYVNNWEDALHVTLFCNGQAPMGACCDMFVNECSGGAGDGAPCRSNDACPGGTCEVVCRTLPQINCTFPPRGTSLQPAWMEGADCEPPPFVHACGVAACCTPQDTCLNLTKNECAALDPIGAGRQWQFGRFCGEGSQSCPFSACLERGGDCWFVHEDGGCNDPECCTDVCELDPWCCSVEWDRACLGRAIDQCRTTGEHDDCWSTRPEKGALPVSDFGSTMFYNGAATQSATDPTHCWQTCSGGPRDGAYCLSDADCAGSGFCALPTVGQFDDSVWFRFVATEPTVRITACRGSADVPWRMHILHATADGGDQAMCNSLELVACASSDQCEDRCDCIEGLIPGQTYYLMFASEVGDVFQLDLASGCNPCCPRPDCNNNCISDHHELYSGDSHDCNENTVLDECDLAAESLDCNRNTVPDECEQPTFTFDSDFDSDVDLADVASLQSCMGMWRWPTFDSVIRPCCAVHEAAPPDSLIDSADWAEMLPAMTGP